jgi:hypothetical protein
MSKTIAVGSHHIKQDAQPSSFVETQWDVNNLSTNFTSGQLIKLTYRHSPRSETMENVFLDYRLTNNGGAGVDVLPVWNCVREMRIYINNRKVLDWNREEQGRACWQDHLLTMYQDDKTRDNYTFTHTGESTTLDGAGLFQPVSLGAGATRQFHLNFNDVWQGFKSLPLTHIGLIEVELNLSNRGNFVCDPSTAIGDLLIDNITVYSKQKRFHMGLVPRAMGSHTFLQHEYDTLVIAPGNHPFASPNQEFDVVISTDFPRRKFIQRLIVFGRDDDPSNPDAYRSVNSNFVDALELRRGGVEILATEEHYDTRRKIYKQVLDYFNRHYHVPLPTHPGDSGHGEAFYTSFVDCTSVIDQVNEGAGHRLHAKEVSGLDNLSNLVLRIRNDAQVLSATSNLVILLEYYRFDRVLGNGNVLRVLEQKP